MGKTFTEIDDALSDFICAQKVFFVATAPSSSDGFLNLSPKGLDTLRLLGPTSLAYLDLTGSGIETVAHLKDDGRFVLMFCAFEGRPRILRLHGRGTVLERGDDGFEALLPLFPALPGTRSIIRLEVERIADSCGWGVPRYEFVEDRNQLLRFAEQIGDEGIREGQTQSNLESIDGLPGLAAPSV